jgi:hypothetical protein
MTNSYQPGRPNSFTGTSQTFAPVRQSDPIQLLDENVDVFGRLKVTRHQNIYEADFEYGLQPLRWENFTSGSATITHLPGQGGVRLRLTTTSGDVAIRQSRPYHRYQPGKSMFLSSAVQFGTALANQYNRVGFFDDGNGAFFEQDGAAVSATNPFGMQVVIRSDASGVPTDTKVPLSQFNGDTRKISTINWNLIQMIWIEYAWYGAGSVRFGVTIQGRNIVLHNFGAGNRPNNTAPWARTGNLPVRYEQRNYGTTAAINDMFHYGVSVMVEGGQDEQRGFTYSYGMALGTPRKTVPLSTTRSPILSIRNRVMGTSEYTQASAAIVSGTTSSINVSGTPWATNIWRGRCVYFPDTNQVARIVSNSTNQLIFADVVTGLPITTAPTAGQSYTIGLINRGQILPLRLLLSSSALAQIEVIASSTSSPIVLTGSSFAAVSTLGSPGSFAERDVSATSLSGGEVVMRFTTPAGGSGLLDLDLSNLFALYNNVRGNVPDVLTIAATTTSASAADIGADIICQEAMS